MFLRYLDDVDDAIDALRQDLMKLSLSGLDSGKWGPAAKLLAFGVAGGGSNFFFASSILLVGMSPPILTHVYEML